MIFVKSLSSLFICILLTIYSASYLEALKSPVLLVPGFGGSRLEARLTGKMVVPRFYCCKSTWLYFNIWLSATQLLPFSIACWADNMRLVFHPLNGTTTNSPNVLIRVPGFGDTDTIEWLNPWHASYGLYLHQIVEFLISMGYEKKKNLFGAPYDWRKAPHELTGYYGDLKKKIEEIYERYCESRITVMSHSYGSLVILFFFNSVPEAWKTKYIQQHVSISGAWGGAVKFLKLFTTGYNFDQNTFILPPSDFLLPERSFSSSDALFPSPRLWNATEVFASTTSKNYTSGNVDQFFDDMGQGEGYLKYLFVQDELDKLKAPNVTLYCIFGTNVSTIESLHWKDGYFPTYKPQESYGDGDGTINLRSLRACELFQNQTEKVVLYPLYMAEHTKILEDDRLHEILRKILIV